MRYKGKLTQWDDVKGFGFVEPIGGGDRAFVHIKAFDSKPKRPVDGDMLIYGTSQDARGRLQAVRVYFSNVKPAHHRMQPQAIGSFSVVCILSFFACMSLWSWQRQLPWIVPAAALLLSALTYLVYAMDKRAAQRGQWRTSENFLHLLAVLGGWPGAWLAQQSLLHKSVKFEFRWMYWLTVIVHVALVNWLVWSWQGQLMVQAMLQWQRSWFY